MLMLGLVLFSIYVVFQLIYILVPIIRGTSNSSYDITVPQKGFTILIPAYNEEQVIAGCIYSLKNTCYQDFEAIIINDGSTDCTFDTLCYHLELMPLEAASLSQLSYKTIKGIYQSALYPYVYVIDKENGGKADALNAGIEYSSKEIIITLDADCVLKPNALQAMSNTFQDSRVVAAGGMVHIVQGLNQKKNQSLLSFRAPNLIKYQIIQYLTAFYLHKRTQAALNSITVIAGAFGAFRRELLLEVKGYRNSIGEDMEITLRIQQLIYKQAQGKKITFVPDAVCYTECPEGLKNLFKQRLRWQKAFLDCIRLYARHLFRDFNKSMSLYLLFDSFLFGTVIAFPTLAVPFFLLIYQSSLQLFFILLSIALALGILQSCVALVISRSFGYSYGLADSIRLLFFIPIEVISYRLLGLLFVTIGTFKYFKKEKSWDKIDRAGRAYELIYQSDIAAAKELQGKA